jgi:hypothetical protein
MTAKRSGECGPANLSLKKKLIFSAILTVVVSTALYSILLAVRTVGLYRAIKDNDGGWRGRLFTVDPVLGFAPVPGARGAQVFPTGQDVPVRFDDDGFRIPDSGTGTAAVGTPRALAFGCSFTFGAACRAEDTYPAYLSQILGFRCLNAGVPSYGLSQIVIRARNLIPKYKPDYVLVQCSPWLVERSQTCYAPSHHGKTPNPYFVESSGGGVAIHPPVFTEVVTELPISAYRDSAGGVEDFASFLFRVGLPLYLHDDFHSLMHLGKRLVALSPAPGADGQKIVDEAYGELAQICAENHARLIIVILRPWTHTDDPYSLSRIPNAQIIDAHAALMRRLSIASVEEYAKDYCHCRGNPPVLIDPHPNAHAHWLIAEEIAPVIRKMEEAKQRGDADSSGHPG